MLPVIHKRIRKQIPPRTSFDTAKTCFIGSIDSAQRLIFRAPSHCDSASDARLVLGSFATMFAKPLSQAGLVTILKADLIVLRVSLQ